MLDTIAMCGNTAHDGDEFSVPQFQSYKHQYLSDYYFMAVEKELQKLADSGVQYIIVSGHFPVWSIAEHGPTQCLVDRLRPLLHKYKVSAYFSGHDHNLQHISDNFMDHSVEYMVSGAANFVSNSTVHADKVPTDSLKFNWPGEKNLIFFDGGFLVVRANDKNMTVTFVQSNGIELYQKVIYPRK